MAERYVVIPAHLAQGGSFGSYEDAVGAAVVQVDKDRAPRLVMRVESTVRPSDAPRAEVAHAG